jgi:hypothetical protein
MFGFAGEQAVEGAIQKIGNSGPQIGHALKKAWDGFLTLPGFKVPPALLQMGCEIPQYVNNAPPEAKQAFVNAGMAALTKLMTDYAKKPA